MKSDIQIQDLKATAMHSRGISGKERVCGGERERQRYIHVHTHIYICIYIYMYVYIYNEIRHIQIQDLKATAFTRNQWENLSVRIANTSQRKQALELLRGYVRWLYWYNMYIYTHVYIYIYTYISMCIYVCVYI